MDIKTMMLNKLKKELADNEENIKAALWMIEVNEAKIKESFWNESKMEVDSQIAFLQDRLIKHTNRRKEILNQIKKLEEK
ncbi:hypothetical protein [Vibrio parahaemolyticus]|uniref:hypothetical protein n=1 Tax=Vibrio parahaemolyticus TaxID=670 RepID=UPI0024AFDA9A|nr:hypothetical protein [Vibrio parahaemolyticus]MDI7854630.1 hypothetical protein [Vibrio parahaemolyticus]